MTRLETIKEERKQLLQMVSDTLKQNKETLTGSIDDVARVIKFDEENTKKYMAIVKAKEIIANLMEQIVECKKPEDISKLRNRVNYYINKIKGELQKRNVTENQISEYTKNVSDLRGNISKFIRCLKRESNIEQIEQLNSKETLVKDEKEQLRKMLRNEKTFNHRYLVTKKDENQEETVIDKSTSIVIDEEKSISEDTSVVEMIDESANLVDVDVSTPATEDMSFNSNEYLAESTDLSLSNESNDVVNQLFFSADKQVTDGRVQDNLYLGDTGYTFKSDKGIVAIYNLDDTIRVLRGNIKRYKSRYNVVEICKYGKSMIKNIAIFIKNLPKYNLNKKRIKRMIKDYRTYYSGKDFYSYIEYSKKRNSIIHGLKSALSHTYLNKEESIYLNNHEQCAEWIMNFCRDNYEIQAMGQYCFVK